MHEKTAAAAAATAQYTIGSQTQSAASADASDQG